MKDWRPFFFDTLVEEGNTKLCGAAETISELALLRILFFVFSNHQQVLFF